MKLTTKLKLLALGVCVAAASLAAGCSIGEKPFDKVADEAGAKFAVTYFGNGGMFDGRDNVSDRELRFVSGVPVLNIKERVDGENVNGSYISRENYIFGGWYYAELDADGNPVYEDGDDTVVKLSSTPVTFPLYAKSEGHIYICAEWLEDLKLEYVLVSDTAITGSDGKQYNSGDTIATAGFGKFQTININAEPFSSTTHTYIQCYSGIECRDDQIVTSVAKPADANAENPRVYAKYIEGNYTVVKDAKGVINMFSDFSSDTSFYVLKDIDCSGRSLALSSGEFNCKIEGNGYTISHLKFTATGLAANNTRSLFGELGATASIKNLKLEDVDITLGLNNTASTNVRLYAILAGMESGAEIEGLEINGLKMAVTIPEGSAAVNIPYDNATGEFGQDNWMFGAEETDAAFLANNDGVTVTNAEFTAKRSIDY